MLVQGPNSRHFIGVRGFGRWSLISHVSHVGVVVDGRYLSSMNLMQRRMAGVQSPDGLVSSITDCIGFPVSSTSDERGGSGGGFHKSCVAD